MKVAIHQPNYLPGLNGEGSFWPKAKAADIFILLDTVQFSRDSYTQRAKLPFNHHHWLTVNVKHPCMVPIKDALIDWRTYKPDKQVKTLESRLRLSLGKIAPWVDALKYGVESLNMDRFQLPGHRYNRPNPYSHLVDWNELLIKKLADSFKVGCQWRRASQIDEKVSETMEPPSQRLKDNPSFNIWYLLSRAGATAYLTGPMWRSYAPNLKEVLKEYGIELQEI
jgi:hypothetical protein